MHQSSIHYHEAMVCCSLLEQTGCVPDGRESWFVSGSLIIPTVESRDEIKEVYQDEFQIYDVIKELQRNFFEESSSQTNGSVENIDL